MKSVLISIQPKWCEKIATREKTIEVRKSRPKIETPFKCYIYCTKDKYEWLYRVDNNGYGKPQSWHGKVIGEFICNEVEKFSVRSLRCDDIENLACLSYSKMIDYFYKPEELDGKTAKQGYAWHISDLKIYDKPKELSEFVRHCRKDKPCIFCGHLKEYGCENWTMERLTRPPQSWQYVVEVDV